MTYYYPIVTSGYRWNLVKRCLWEVGIEPVCVGDTTDQTFVQFSRPLTGAEKTALDTLMASNPQQPKAGDAVVIKIGDLWEKFEQFKASVNLPNLRLYYSETVPGSGVIDQIEIHHPTALTTTQKNAIKTAYNNLLQ